MADVSATACVRVRDGAGQVVGSGFLVGPDLVASCAHVVAEAAGSDPFGESAPQTGLTVDFPALPGFPSPRRALVHRWVPIDRDDGTGDVALLRLDTPAPPGAVMPPVRRVDRLWDASFRVFGFPEGRWDGVWSTGRFRGVQGTGWFQLQGTPGDQPIEGGFSGAPVWDDRTGAVVGMTVAADRDPAVTTAYLLPIEQVLGLDPELLPCPYRGLEPFGEEHAEYFFGRGPEIDRLAETLRRCPLVAVVGPSGAGKSSLIRAGLIPRLRAEGAWVTELRLGAGNRGSPEAVAAVLTLARRPGQDADPHDRDAARIAAALAHPDTRDTTAAELASEFTDDVGAGHRVLLVDQFEELAAAEPRASRELLDALAAVALAAGPDSALRIVLTMRGIGVNDVLTPQTAEILGPASVFVGALERAQLRDAIVCPADRAPGLAFEDGLVDRILDDAGTEPGQLSLVESLLAQLWSRREGGTLTLEGYEAAGGVAGALAAHAERVVATVLAHGGNAEQLRDLCTRLTATGRDGQFIRRAVRLDELPERLGELVLVLAAARLVVDAGPSHHTPAGSVELAHQALIDHWPRLRRWLEDDRAFLSWRSELDVARERWESQHRDEGALLRGGALETATNWTRQRPDEVTAAEADYVHHSRRRRRRDIRRWRTATAVLAVLVLVAATATVISVQRGNQLSGQLRAANAELVAQAALARAPSDPVITAQLALLAWKLDPSNPNARDALSGQYAALRSMERVFPAVSDQPILGFDPTHDGRAMIVQSGRGLVVVSGLDGSAAQRWEVPDVPANYRRANLSPDGRRIAVVDASGAVWTWNVETRQGPTRLSGAGTADPSTIEFSPDGRRLLWLSPRGPGGRILHVWRLVDRTRVQHDLGPITDPGVSSVEQTLDPDLVLVRFGDPKQDPGSTRLVMRSMTDGATVRTFPPGTAVARGGASVVSCVDGPAEPPGKATAVVSRPDLGTEVARFELLDGPQCSTSFVPLPRRVSQDRSHLVELRTFQNADYDVARITSLVDGRSYEVVLPPNTATGSSSGSALTPANTITVSAISARPAVLVAQGTSVMRLRAAPTIGDERASLSISSDGRLLVARSGPLPAAGPEGRTSFDRGFVVFDRQSREVLGRLPGSEIPGSFHNGTMIDGGLHLLTSTATEFLHTEYRLPTLALEGRHPLSRIRNASPERGDEPHVAVRDDRVYSLDDGVLTVLSRASGETVHDPVRLARGSRSVQWYSDNSFFRVRPGHPDEVAVLGPDHTVELWNVAEGSHLASLPKPGGRLPYRFAFSPDGAKLAALTGVATLDLWDVAAREPARAPIPAVGAHDIVGFSPDGYVLTVGDDPGEGRLRFWDLDAGVESGSLRLPNPTHSVGDNTDGRLLAIDGGLGALPYQLPVTGREWFDRLCAVADRPFTPAERALLPPGVGVEPPCT